MQSESYFSIFKNVAKLIPLNFQSIPGLEEIKSQLINSVREGKIAHALLFQGKRGVLNLPIALAFAQYLHCENRGKEDVCGQCASCQLSKKFIHPDTHFAYPVGNMKSTLETGTDEELLRAELKKYWRSFLIENPFGSEQDWIAHYGGEDKQPIISKEESREIIKSLSLKSFQSKFKVMIIWQPEMMHPAAANGILKIVEEPPPNTIFILVSSRIEQLLPTILSRTQIVTIPLLSDEQIEEQLINAEVSKSKIDNVVALAAGNLNQALRLAEEEEAHHHGVFLDWMRSCFKGDFARIISLADAFHEKDRLYQNTFLQYAMSMIRETLIGLCGADTLHRTRGEEREFVNKFKGVFNTHKLNRAYQLLNEAGYFIDRNGSAKMIFTDLSIQFNRVMKQG